MQSLDDRTLDFYAGEAETYALQARWTANARLSAFLDLPPAGAAILELGCGGGQDSHAMLERGFKVTPTDGSPDMARQAEAFLKRPVAVLPFDQLDAVDLYDGIWANACLLHVQRAELAGILSRIHRALKAGGIFYASYKAGTAEGRDRFDRYYNYPSPDWLLRQYAASPWQHIDIAEDTGSGYDGEKTAWLHVTAVRTS